MSFLEKKYPVCLSHPQIPHEMVSQSRNSYVEADLQALTLEDLCKQEQHEEEEEESSWPVHLDSRLQVLLKEARDKAKGWVSCQSSDNTELAYKKVVMEIWACLYWLSVLPSGGSEIRG